MKTLKRMTHAPLAWLGVLLVVAAVAALLRLTVSAQDSGGGATWAEAGIGGATGTVQVDAGILTVTESGADLWGSSDGFYYVYQPLNGDGEITARVLGINGTNEWAKAGVMIRETLEAGSRNALMFSSLSHGLFYEWRTAAGADTDHDVGNTNLVTPCWVRLVRHGDWIGGYTSPDGLGWTQVNWRIYSGLAPQVYVGLAVTSRGPSQAGFDQVNVEPAEVTEELSPQVGNGDGLAGSYYNNRHLSGAAVSHRVDAQVDFNLKQLLAAAGPGGTSNLCSALFGKPSGEELGIRWTGEIQAQFTEPYILHLTGDDGLRVWLNEQLVIDDWTTHPAQEVESAPLNLVAGQRYLIRIEYFQNHDDAVARLAWRSPSTPLQLVPQSQLYSQPTDTDGNGLPDAWELHYFGQTGVDPNADPDGDGLSNLQEYQQHRDPTSALNWGVPNEWSHGDIGTDMGASGAGAAVYQQGTYTVSSSGGDIWQGRDTFHFMYQPLGTNGQVVARLLGQSGMDAWRKGGLMLRESLADTARNVALLVKGSNQMDFQWRPSGGLETLQRVSGTNAWNWLKLVRNGDWVGAYVSADGTNWTLFDWEGISRLAGQVFVGVAVSSHAPTTTDTNVAAFDQVSVGPADPSEVMNPYVGTGDGLLGNYRNDSLLYLPGITNEVDQVIDFDWGHQKLLPGLDPNSYGICWSGEIQAQFSEPYTLSFACQAGEWVRVWLNEQLIINQWRVAHVEGEFSSAPINLVAGQKYLIRVEMYDNQGRGVSQLNWSSPSTSDRPIAQNQMYSQPTDTDGNGLPDLWEQHYFGHIGVDPHADPDGDGLSNLQEYQYHTDPTQADTDGDGIPDAWEVAHGLDPQYANDAALDYDNDGLSNYQKYQQGLDTFNTDADGDGVPDSLELNYLGIDPKTPHVSPATVVLTVNGAQATNLLGGWQVDGSDLFALDRRGGVDFNLNVKQADKYVVNVVGTQNQPNAFATSFKLLLGIDGQTLGHYTLNAGYGTNGEVALVLPYLPAGAHTLHVFWDGVASYSSLRLKQVKLLSIAGPDANHNGIKDWAEKLMADESGLDNTNAVISSYVSPACLEGRDIYPNCVLMTNNLANALSAVGTTDGRWYVNAPLSAGTQTVFQASYQNGGVNETRQLQWLPVNLLTATNPLTIRKGDSLLFNVGGANGTLQIMIGTNTATGKAAKGIAYKFGSPGTYTVAGTYTPNSGLAQNGNVSVVVVPLRNLPTNEPAAWTGMPRNLNLPNLAPEAVLQADSRLNCALAGTNANGAVQLSLGTEINEPRSLLARLGTNGPVLDSTQVEGFDVFAGNQASTAIVQVYPDGSQLVEEVFISSPVLPDVTFELDVIVSGVIFEDGTTTKTLTAADFDPLGQCRVRFIRPAGSQTSVCHNYKAFQGSYLIGFRH